MSHQNDFEEESMFSYRLDGEKYITLNSKNAKLPMLKDGKITYWSRVKITAHDKDGKAVKAPSQSQVRKLIK